MADLRRGIDLGGTKIEGILIDARGQELARHRMPTPKDDYPGTVEAIAHVLGQVAAASGRPPDALAGLPVGVGIPGAVSRATGLIKNANSTWLIGRDLAGDLAARLDCPVRLANDANCFALSEAADGAGAGAASVFGVILGTGVGGGLVAGGRLIQGANDIAGEWGHNPLPWPRDDERPGPDCYCGRQGCLETFLSGPALARMFEARTGRRAAPAEIAGDAAAGDPDAAVVMDLYADRLARGLAHVVNIFDPEVIVLGGGLSNIDALYAQVPARWGPWIFSDMVETRLARNRWGDSGGVRGAAWLWDR